jgi:hypothetical protein
VFIPILSLLFRGRFADMRCLFLYFLCFFAGGLRVRGVYSYTFFAFSRAVCGYAVFIPVLFFVLIFIVFSVYIFAPIFALISY